MSCPASRQDVPVGGATGEHAIGARDAAGGNRDRKRRRLRGRRRRRGQQGGRSDDRDGAQATGCHRRTPQPDTPAPPDDDIDRSHRRLDRLEQLADAAVASMAVSGGSPGCSVTRCLRNRRWLVLIRMRRRYASGSSARQTRRQATYALARVAWAMSSAAHRSPVRPNASRTSPGHRDTTKALKSSPPALMTSGFAASSSRGSDTTGSTPPKSTLDQRTVARASRLESCASRPSAVIVAHGTMSYEY